jgi:hypothetical protein
MMTTSAARKKLSLGESEKQGERDGYRFHPHMMQTMLPVDDENWDIVTFNSVVKD